MCPSFLTLSFLISFSVTVTSYHSSSIKIARCMFIIDGSEVFQLKDSPLTKRLSGLGTLPESVCAEAAANTYRDPLCTKLPSPGAQICAKLCRPARGTGGGGLKMAATQLQLALSFCKVDKNTWPRARGKLEGVLHIHVQTQHQQLATCPRSSLEML